MSVQDLIEQLKVDDITSPPALWAYRLKPDSLSEAIREGDVAGDQLDRAQAARGLERVGRRLSAEGFRDDALRATTKAVEIVGELAVNPDRNFEGLRLHCLIALATQLDDLGQPDAAPAFQHAIEELRRLPPAPPSLADLLSGQAENAEAKPMYPLELAHALLGAAFSQLSDDPEADVEHQLLEASEVVKHLGDDSGLADFVRAVLPPTSSPIGRALGALVPAPSAIKFAARRPIWRRDERESLYNGLDKARAENKPEEEIKALRSLATFFGDVGRFEDAAAALNGAASLQRPLVNCDNPSTYLERVAILTEYERRLSEAGASEEVIAARREICDLYQSLWTADPATYRPGFAASLRILRDEYERAKDPSLALLTQQRLVVLLQPATASTPDEDLAYARELLRLADHLSGPFSRNAADQHDATSQFETAALLCLCRIHDTAQEGGDNRSPTAHDSMISEACFLMRRRWVAIDASRWTRPSAAKLWVDVILRLAAASPSSFLSQLAQSFQLTCSVLVRTGLSAAALSAYSNALNCVRTSAAALSTRHKEAFLDLLDGFQRALADLGRDVEAADILREALATRRTMTAAGEGCDDKVLCDLEALLELLAKLDRRQEGSDVRREIIQLLRQRIERSPGADTRPGDVLWQRIERALGAVTRPGDEGQSEAIADLGKLASHLEAADMLDEALAVRRKLVDIAWVAFEANPLGVGFGRSFGPFNSTTRLRLVDSLRCLMILLERAGATSELAAVEDELASLS